ncbi:MAG TPA: MotA/TolQ/ExbB proton channel family protein [Acidisoma sp.]|jgi:chemotaxis protein MotA|uniref:motility protein A n=1 Tax=Acidisoma sp. TaxID=1872115 RepID=UPI002C5C33BB|nr:MotA/TolQ/ExbB proton channel family protein [Acidisoma sp.]HTI03617.1 MotA/TolQ/ExbB proton channel family protein [Acidisoma sp.]
MSAILGIVAALAMVILAAVTDGDPISSLFSVTAVLIVFGGTGAAVTTQFGVKGVLTAGARFKWLVKPPAVDMHAFIEQVAAWSNLARSQGALALESELETVEDPFQKQGLQMIIDNTAEEDMLPTLEAMAANAAREDTVASEVWEAAGGYLPTIGVMGAVLGLIHVMMELDHPAELGVGIATAFVATVYGVGSANLIALPLGARLGILAEARERERHLIIQGLMLLKQGKSGILIRQTMQNLLAKDNRKKPDEVQTDAAESDALAEAV